MHPHFYFLDHKLLDTSKLYTLSRKANYNFEFQDLKKHIRDIQGKGMNGLNLFQGESIAVTNGAFGQTYTFDTTDLTAANYGKVVDDEVYSPPPFTWDVTKDVWATSKAGYMLREDAYKITEPYYTVKSGQGIYHLKQNAWLTKKKRMLRFSA